MQEKKFDNEIQELSKHILLSEKDCTQQFISALNLSEQERNSIHKLATRFVSVIRNNKHSPIQSFVHEYSLSTEEGVAIMCLAESLLRIPDNTTAKELIQDKLRSKD